jgi:hypothetical protein
MAMTIALLKLRLRQLQVSPIKLIVLLPELSNIVLWQKAFW